VEKRLTSCPVYLRLLVAAMLTSKFAYIVIPYDQARIYHEAKKASAEGPDFGSPPKFWE